MAKRNYSFEKRQKELAKKKKKDEKKHRKLARKEGALEDDQTGPDTDADNAPIGDAQPAAEPVN